MALRASGVTEAEPGECYNCTRQLLTRIRLPQPSTGELLTLIVPVQAPASF